MATLKDKLLKNIYDEVGSNSYKGTITFLVKLVFYLMVLLINKKILNEADIDGVAEL